MKKSGAAGKGGKKSKGCLRQPYNIGNIILIPQ
jgi:hypothetical protein